MLSIQCIRTLEGQPGDITCTAEVHKMNKQRRYTELRIHNATSLSSYSDKAVVLVYTYLNSGLMQSDAFLYI